MGVVPSDAPSTVPLIDLNAYFRRIGYGGSREPSLATLRALHLHHVLAVPFENLDVLLDRTLSLELAAVEQKIVHQRRGGYCFEQNTLFGAVLRSLGFEVSDLIARVRWQVPPERGTPRTHMILRVTAGGEEWIVDTGFGSMGLTAPLCMMLDREQETPHEPRRLIRRGDHIVHQVHIGPDWLDVFQFTPEPVPPVDFEVANWFTNRNPCSSFRQNLIVARVRADGRALLFNREFTRRYLDGRVEKRDVNSPDELLALLADTFDLNFPAGTRFGQPGSAWPA